MIIKKSVAIMVHNDVLKDARVRKEARALVAHGFAVDIYGFSPDGNAKYPSTIENGASLTIETRKTFRQAFWLYQVAKKIINELRKRIRQFPLLCSTALAASFTLIGGVLTTYLGAVESIIAASTGLMLLGALGLLLRYRTKNSRLKWHYNSIALSLEKSLDGKTYDYIHCHDIIALIAGSSVKRRNNNVVLIWDAHELYTELQYKDPATNDYIHSIIQDSSKLIDRFVTISETFARQYEERYPALPKGLVVMNATRRQESNDLRINLLHSAANIQSGQKILLFQGGFSPHRGIEKLLAAALDLPAEWSVVFMGYGPLKDLICEFGKKHNSARGEGKPFVALLPPASHEELRHWTSGATLGIIPYENTSLNHLHCMPNKLWEYPNARVPILATDLVEIGKTIRRYEIGALLPRDFSSVDIVETINSITEEQLENWKRSCDHYNEVENWEKYESNFLAAYQ